MNNQVVIKVDVWIEAARREDGSEVQARHLSYREEGGVVGWERRTQDGSEGSDDLEVGKQNSKSHTNISIFHYRFHLIEEGFRLSRRNLRQYE